MRFEAWSECERAILLVGQARSSSPACWELAGRMPRDVASPEGMMIDRRGSLETGC
jgi:hypothetical protein